MTEPPKQAATSYPTTNMTSLTDAQLRQTITQLSNAANTQYQHYVSPATQSTSAAKGEWPTFPDVCLFEIFVSPRKSTVPKPKHEQLHRRHSAYLKNVHTWSTTSTPRGSGSRARNRTNKTVPVAPAPTYVPPPVYQPPPPPPVVAAPPPPPPQPNPPKHPLPVVPQATHSAYASRLRTGATLLMQPILNSTTTTARASTRRSGMVNYTEPGSGDEFPDAGALDSDDSDFVASGGTRTAVRQSRAKMGTGMSVFYSGSGMSTPQPQQATARTAPTPGTVATATAAGEKMELEQSYLGMIPPSRLVKARPIGPTSHEYPSLDALEAQSRKRIALVPIRVEFETETHRIRDCFVWNLYETLVKPETFAKIFCTDLDLPIVPWAETVANQIRAQLEEHEGVASLDLGVEGYGTVDHCDSDNGGDSGHSHVDDPPENGGEIPECRVILSIDVQIATHHLMDHIEWDLLSPLTPEDFSKQLCAELGLSGEAIPLISHAIHEELIKHKKDAIEWGVIGGDSHRESAGGASSGVTTGGGGEETTERKTGGGVGVMLKDKTGLGHGWGRTPRENRGPKTLQSVWREWSEAEEFRTRFEELTAEEVERREIERERASRRLRRETSKFQTTRTRRR
ncbi:hypothetical protein ID866_6613 [Astraeus odoratus]|nr:hypothetical protein ID866_6613 [Astraeus odoratus]